MEELEVVEGVRRVGGGDGVGEPELRGGVDGDVDGDDGGVVADEGGGGGEGIVGVEGGSVFRDGEDGVLGD